jgi:hypothetical protein
MQTYVGDILVAVNPFKDLPLYSSDVSLFLLLPTMTQPVSILATSN